MTERTDDIIAATREWVESFVIGLNLCPFARKEMVRNRIRFCVTEAASPVELMEVLESELDRITADADIGTTLIIHPAVLTDFETYLDFLDVADDLLVEKDLEGEIQIASFHPDYLFAGTDADDASNWTNRSPHPMLHLLREEDVERAVETHPDVEGIPERNIALMEELGVERLRKMMGLG
ncbi:MAG: DUF1415 domain-containing protein [Bacteroidetes bacterium]|nr:DUF1415 domain-containing protein [Bacteroidota bacterium]